VLKKNKKKIILGLVVSVVATFFMSTNVCAYRGIDISINDEYVDFNSVVNDDCSAIIIKATEGVDFKDKALERNYQGAKASNVKHLGFYHFMSEKTNPSQQARDFWNAIKDKSYDIMPCLDIENNSYGRSAYEITNRCLEFIQTFKELSGQNVMIYSGAFFAKDNLDFRIKTQPLWVASYGRSPIPTGFLNVIGWQYSETGRISGISTYVDLNDFNDNMLLSNSNYVLNIPSVIDSQDNSGSTSIKQASEFVGNRCGELQGLLIAKGYNCGGFGVDNEFGQGTYDSLIQFQKDYGLVPDVLAGELTFAKLYENQSNSNNSTDTRVLELQRLCNSINNAKISEDNVWGSQTEKAVKNLPLCGIKYHQPQLTKWIQARLGCSMDGIYYYQTKNSVINWQKSHNLKTDGVCGFYSLKSLALD
jgi:GH25 family lysozyme M1 (1,4-beta-N-acetylmuramidase)/peptidoglycan hydrolase-like protein with peptidoglycan-binding domain